MALPEPDALALRAKAAGTEYYKQSNFSNAFPNFLLALNIRNDWLEELKEPFIQCLCEWGIILERLNRYSDLFTCYEEALKIYPRSEVILNNLGAHLLRLNHFKEATRYFKECLTISPSYLPAYRNIENVSNHLVERWHFRMLNDSHRNNCYREAIHKCIQESDTVLDIGTGSGLLSLFAAEKNPCLIYACDYSETMASLAKDIVRKNEFSDKVKVINKCSSDLTIPDDLNERVNVVVTEIMDAGLLGEGILQSLDDSFRRLLVQNNSQSLKIIPNKASLYIAPIECLKLAKKYKLIKDQRVDGSIKINFDATAILDEPYDSEDMKQYNYKFLSKEAKLFDFDFTNAQNIRDHIEGRKNSEINLEMNETGYLDALLVWFELKVDDNQMISTLPQSDYESCWEQAIFPINENIIVEHKTILTIEMTTSNGKLSLQNYNIDSFKNKNKVYKVSREVITFLNSKSTLKILHDFIVWVINEKKTELEVLDLYNYPYIGMKILEVTKGKLLSFVCNETDIEFFKEYSTEKKLDASVFECNSFSSIQDKMANRKFDVIVLEILNVCGELNDGLLAVYPLIRNSLKTGGILFPQQLSVHCQLVYSDWLEKNSKFKNPSLSNDYKGFECLNEFKVTHFIDLDINRLKHIKMSDIMDIATINIDNLYSNASREYVITTRASNDGSINAILYWYTYGNEEIKISTSSHDFYRNQEAEILDQTLMVKAGDYLSVRLNYMSCILKFNVGARVCDNT